MGLAKVVLFFAFATLSLSNALIVPSGKELVYEYRALVKAGTHHPASHVSQFILQGNLHIITNNNVSQVQLSDLTYKLYNGILNHVHEHNMHEIPLPAEVYDLQKPFQIVYDQHGKVSEISLDPNELQYVKNIKRGIAAILQLDSAVLQQTKPYAFITQEHSLYGYGQVNYNVLPQGDVIVVHKLHEMNSNHHMYKYVYSNLEAGMCETNNVDPLIHDSQRKYIIVQEDGHHVVKAIEADGGIYYFPYNSRSDAQYLLSNQTLNLVKVGTSQQQISLLNVENNLNYYLFDFNKETEAVPEITNGRRVINLPQLIPVIQQMLQEIWQYLNGDHINMNVPEIKNGQLINRLQRLLMAFDIQHLEELHDHLIEKTSGQDVEVINVFYQVLPLVGSKASSLLIKKIVIQNKLKQDILVDMLQNLPRHVKVPSQSLVADLEQLAQLPETVPWSVRKVGILVFGSLVHRAHQHQIRVHENLHSQNYHDYHHVHNEPNVVNQYGSLFEKYLVDYIAHVNTSQDYKMQAVYLQGIFNMKLPSIMEHLGPAIRGEWWGNPHLRLLSLWTVYPVIGHNPELLFQVLWPLVTNWNENTELRIVAYFLLMESNPNSSRLTNIYWTLMNEHNEELYHFHWTYVNTIVQSVEPCRQGLKWRLTQLKRYMQPPSHGLSSYYGVDYRDAAYGFSGGLSGLFIHTNVSQIFSFVTTSQLFNRYMEDSVIFVKFHGFNKYLGEVHKWEAESLIKFLEGIHAQKDFHIEITLVKQNEVTNTFYLNENNIHELKALIDFIINPQAIVKKNILHITYERYVKIFFPADVGIPIVWDFLLPSVHKHVINVKKEVVNKVINIQVDNQHIHWAHHRQGLTFYNPIADVWQGINRYVSYDSVTPFNYDLILNPQQKSLKLSIRRHNDFNKSIWGYRSHASQLVFVKDDNNKNLLKQSCQSCNEWTVVSFGENYRNKYTLMEKDDLNTGVNWHVAAFDSDRHISNGTFNHLWHVMVQPYTKSSNGGIFAQSLLSYLNWHHYMILWPQPGNLGVMVKLAPTTLHSISNIDLTIRWNHEITQENYVYNSGAKISTRLTYAVKNKEQSLKTWDVNAILDLNPGHTVNNLKLHLTRIIPGQKDYKICVDGVKRWYHDRVTGYLNIAMSQTPDGKCVKDDTLIEVNMVGEHLIKREYQTNAYASCSYVIPYSVTPYHTLECLADHTSIRKYDYDVEFKNVPSEFKNILTDWWDSVKGHLFYYYSNEEPRLPADYRHVKVEVVYPVQSREVNIQITTMQHLYKLEAVPTQNWNLGGFGFVPDSTVYSKWYLFIHSIGLVNHCVIYHDYVTLNHNSLPQTAPNDWSVYMANSIQNPQNAVFVKSLGNNQIGLKIVENKHVIEVVPQNNYYKIAIDGESLNGDLYQEDWVTLQVLHMVNQELKTVAVMLPHVGIHLEYNGQQINAIIPKGLHNWTGHCNVH